jgi:hypothetical protein
VAYGDRKSLRITFESGIKGRLIAIDGTWTRGCMVRDISHTGARIVIDGTTQGLELKEFFLLLSTTGTVYRRCRLVRRVGDDIGVEFLRSIARR